MRRIVAIGLVFEFVVSLSLPLVAAPPAASQKPARADQLPSEPSASSHHHEEHGPHDGEILEVGKEEYHLELCVDESKKQVTLFLLGKDAKTAVAIEDTILKVNAKVAGKPTQFQLKGVSQSGDPQGQYSRYSLQSPELVHALHDTKSDARIAFMIAKKQYAVRLKHDHDHAGHQHAQGPQSTPKAKR